MRADTMENDLRAALAAYQIGPDTASLTFANRLARENRWSPHFARRVIREYKRFCFLAVTVGHEVTPSDAVDQAWHLHLTYSRDYWERFCPAVLGAPLHHGPTAGGDAEWSRYYEQYAQTLASYEAAFEEAPPADIWPPASRRFGVDPRAFRVNSNDVIVLSRHWATVAGWAIASALLTAFLVGRIS
ncbi:hypothetical protein D6201_05020 [Aurantiacibacter aquimixticola]|uniref:Uncharacterized protein n=2 Tax=Aurantiacibacter aquimixticola TaxID=1958945 RepID=A0A419RWR3_9SPHN|nr:hypothetical protein D6201_05020 [Aurantiacibacter aquimixticola]